MVRSNSVRGRDGRVLQDLNYVCDPVGNVTSIRDDAQQTVFFANTQVEPHSDYVYDALYRLVEARGREHAAQNASQRDAGRLHADRRHPVSQQPGGAAALPRAVRLRQRRQHPLDAARRRRCRALDAPLSICRRQQSSPRPTSDPGDGANAFSSAYCHDAHGNMTRMPHLPVMRWDFKDRLQASERSGGQRGRARDDLLRL